MISTVSWMAIALWGIVRWAGMSKRARDNEEAFTTNGHSDPMAAAFAQGARAMNTARVAIFVVYLALGVVSLYTLLGHPSAFFLRIYLDVAQAVVVLGAFVFALNGEIANRVAIHVDHIYDEMRKQEAQKRKVPRARRKV